MIRGFSLILSDKGVSCILSDKGFSLILSDKGVSCILSDKGFSLILSDKGVLCQVDFFSEHQVPKSLYLHQNMS